MKIKVAIILLAVACVGLFLALFATKKQGEEQRVTLVTTINVFSNQVVEANEQLKDLSQANLALTNDLALSRLQSLDFSNSLASAVQTLNETKASLATAQGQITNMSSQIGELETQNKALDQRANELNATIAQMNALISTTQSRLAQAETNTMFLQTELQNQMARKAELEHKFSDVNEIRTQYGKLKEEIFIARHRQLAKNDNSGKKGVELLKPKPTANTDARMPINSDLNVEVGTDGSVKIIPPLGYTNAPAR